MASRPGDATRLLNRYGRGEREVERELLAAIYGELHALAVDQMERQPPAHTLQPTALIHEAWLRLVRQDELEFATRAQFYALASRVMRSVLVDHARRATRDKRGGGARRLSFEELDEGGADPGRRALEVLSLEEALRELERVEPDLCRLVELRFFGGLSHAEIAEAMDVSLRTVERNWRAARAFLSAELEG